MITLMFCSVQFDKGQDSVIQKVLSTIFLYFRAQIIYQKPMWSSFQTTGRFKTVTEKHKFVCSKNPLLLKLVSFRISKCTPIIWEESLFTMFLRVKTLDCKHYIERENCNGKWHVSTGAIACLMQFTKVPSPLIKYRFHAVHKLNL